MPIVFVATNWRSYIPNFDVWCHYTALEDEVIGKYIAEYDLKKIIAIPETAGLHVTEESIEVVGPSNVRFFSVADKGVCPGELITF